MIFLEHSVVEVFELSISGPHNPEEEGEKKGGGTQKYAIVKDWPFFQRMEEQRCYALFSFQERRIEFIAEVTQQPNLRHVVKICDETNGARHVYLIWNKSQMRRSICLFECYCNS